MTETQERAAEKVENSMKTLEQRHTEAINKIGGTAGLLNLPEQVKEILKGKYDLETKTKMLEAVAEAMGK
jgi:hypothetical protein